MVIKGIDKLKKLDALNRVIFKDGSGWHFLLYNLPESFPYDNIKAFKPDPEYVVVDLAQENNCSSADEVRELLDYVMQLFYEKKLPVSKNGFVGICDEVDRRELKLNLSSYQIEMLLQGLWSIGDYCTNRAWSLDTDPEYFKLLDMLCLSDYDKREMSNTIYERRQEYLNKLKPKK